MKTLVIHPTDPTTDFLKEVYADIDCKIITKKLSRSKLKRAMLQHDKIIMLGHGTKDGLVDATGTPIIDSKIVYLLRYKYCVYAWCNAIDFVKKYKLKGFATGMIISDHEEALDYCIDTSGIQIREANELFASILKKHIKCTSKLLFGRFLYDFHHEHNEIVDFNADNIFYLK